jgi:dTDP-4-amino-4,6-dideoxygalactose transaminase
MKIPLVDPKLQYEALREEIDAAYRRVLASGQFILGKEVEAFEEEFARYCGVRYAVGLNSGTSALSLALQALGVGPGDEVITVSLTFVATVEAISLLGARPRFVDIDEKSYTLDPAQIEAAITKKTKGIIPVHLYGQPADMDPILDLAKKRKLFVLEDAAQAHGALYKGNRVGSLGHAACFSFYPTKNLSAFGEGGAVVTNDAKLALQIKKLRNHGGIERYTHELIGTNARMEAFHGAVLRAKLTRLDSWNELRRKHARTYGSLLKGLDLVLPQEAPYAKSVFHVYVIRAAERDRLNAYLNEQGIGSAIHYPTPSHLLECYRPLGCREGDLPVTERVAREVLSLPVYPEMTEDQLRFVAETVRTGLEPGARVDYNSRFLRPSGS